MEVNIKKYVYGNAPTLLLTKCSILLFYCNQFWNNFVISQNVSESQPEHIYARLADDAKCMDHFVLEYFNSSD